MDRPHAGSDCLAQRAQRIWVLHSRDRMLAKIEPSARTKPGRESSGSPLTIRSIPSFKWISPKLIRRPRRRPLSRSCVRTCLLCTFTSFSTDFSSTMTLPSTSRLARKPSSKTSSSYRIGIGTRLPTRRPCFRSFVILRVLCVRRGSRFHIARCTPEQITSRKGRKGFGVLHSRDGTYIHAGEAPKRSREIKRFVILRALCVRRGSRFHIARCTPEQITSRKGRKGFGVLQSRDGIYIHAGKLPRVAGKSSFSLSFAVHGPNER